MTKFKTSAKADICPEREIMGFTQNFPEEVADNAAEVLEVFGKRARYMRYAPNEVHEGGCYISAVLLSTGDLGMKLAYLLNKMVSNEPIHDTGRVILVHDMNAPSEIPYLGETADNSYMLKKDADKGIHLLQDDNYVVWLRSNLLFTEMYIAAK